MTVGTQSPRVEYTEDGATTLFAVPYAFFDDTDLVVTRFTGTGTHDSDSHTLILGHDFSVSGGDTGDGPAVGAITLLTASVADAELRIDRFTKRSQELHYVPGDDFPARSHEDGLDRLEMQIQELERDNLSLEDIMDEFGEHILRAGNGIRIDYDDENNTITITALTIDEAIADLPDCLMLSGDQQTFTGEDGEGPATGLTAENVRDIVAAMLTEGSNVTLTYNDAGDTLTIASTGGGGGGGELGALLTDIDATGIADNELLLGSGPNTVDRLPISVFMQGLMASANASALLAAIGGLGITASSLGNPGYLKLSNGLKLSWGSTTLTANTTSAVNYPSAYASFSIAVGSGGDSSTSDPANARVRSCATASFTVCNNNGEDVPFFWIAVGV